MMRIAIIDNDISPSSVYELTGKRIRGYRVHSGSCREAEEGGRSRSHGTVCAALLAEFAPEARIVGVSVGTAEDFSVQNVCAALRWCGENEVPCICMSMGTTNWLGARPLAEETKRLFGQGARLLCAVSPSGSLTFPACYSWVTGVNCDPAGQGLARSCDSRLGYDVCAGAFASRVLERLTRENAFFTTRTSSMAVPYTAGFLQHGGEISSLPVQKKPAGLPVSSWPMPVVRLRNSCGRGADLARRFQEDEYAAVLASDGYETDWASLTVRVDSPRDLDLLGNALQESGLVLLDYAGPVEFPPESWDYEIDLSGRSMEEAYRNIRAHFSA